MPPPEEPSLRLPRSLLVASQLLIFSIVCALLYWAQFLVVPIALAILCAFVLQPLVSAIERRGIKRVVCVIAVMAVALGILGFLGWIFAKQLNDLVGELPKYRQNIKEKLAGVRGMTDKSSISKLQDTFREVGEEIEAEKKAKEEQEEEQKEKEREEAADSRSPDSQATPTPPRPAREEEDPVPVRVVTQEDLLDLSLSELGPLVDIVFKAALVIILTALFLLWREDLVERLVGLAGRAKMAVTTTALSDAGSRISRYLGLQFGVNMTYAIVASVGLHLLGIPYAAVWGGFAGLLRYIPYVGSILGTLSATLAALIMAPGWQIVVYVFLFYVTIDILVNVAEPFVFGPGLGVSALAVLLSVVVLGWLWGPVGALLATPFAVCLVVLGEYVPGLSFLAWLMSEQPRLEPYINFYHRLLRHDYDGAAQLLHETDDKADSQPAAIESVVAPTLDQVLSDLRSGSLAASEAEWIGQAIADIVEAAARAHPGDPPEGEALPRILVCPPVTALDEAAAAALSWTRGEVPADLSFSDRGRLVSEVIADLREDPARALLILAPAGDEARHVHRWSRLLAHAGIELPLLVFSWRRAQGASITEDDLHEAGAAEVLRGLDELVAWLGTEAEGGPPDHSGDPPASAEPLAETA